ncbi:hypothetical protein SAMN05428988_2493 [Chitinophaga sp. YR573]|uniref:hypothetical protein n=1 Tax=Chitinophaga sp. YR573 TaxID=1881040 RepID=UPI0008AB27E0|nr:hypothetical protein [Chitinophaga sp. YR573]SEW14836.1 hypothetical protein SAMN05428988_2493 [Chitinophaga sp. YR573]
MNFTSAHVVQCLSILASIASILPLLTFFTGKEYLEKFNWFKNLPNWGRKLILFGMPAVFLAIAIVLSIPKSEKSSREHPPKPSQDSSHREEKPPIVINVSTTPVTHLKPSKAPVNTGNSNDVQVIVRVNSQQNDEFSALLAKYYESKSYNVTIGDIPDISANNTIVGDLTSSEPVEDESKQFVNYTLKLVLKIHKGNSTPCAKRVYEEKLPLAPGDSLDKLVQQAFADFLRKIEAANLIPVCS